MSFEGYYQALCKNGHECGYDCYMERDKCCYCDTEIVWTNLVDLTNGVDPDTGFGYGYVELEEKTPAVTCTCPTCGDNHEVKPETYAIPDGNSV